MLQLSCSAAVTARAPRGAGAPACSRGCAGLQPAAKCLRPRRSVSLSTRAGDASGEESPGGDDGSAEAGTCLEEAAWVRTIATLQRLAASSTPSDVLAACAACGGESLSQAACERLLEALVELRRTSLALELYQLLRGPGGEAGVARWAPLGAGGASALARALCRALAVPEALQVVGSLCWGASAGGGSPGSSSAVPRLSFGYVVRCPHCAQQSDDPQVQPPSLSLVQPQEGLQRCACARCGYDFQLFSGTVRSASSQAVAPGAAPDQGGPLAQLRRALRLDPSVAAVHELEVATPCGTLVRAYRVGTRGPEVPAAVGQRVSVACAAPESLEGVGGAQRSKRERSALGRLLPPRPPRTRAGQALDLSNQATGAVTPLLVPPPPPGVPSDFDPSRLLPTLLLLAAAADGASALVDPALPALLLTGGAVSLAGAAAADALLLPRLARLPAAALSLEAQRQGLLQQHSALSAQAAAQAVGCGEDVRALARLWQLQSKMESVNDPQLYAQRLTRVKAARGALEARLDARMALLERYARVATLIEIEIECEGEELRGAQQGIELEMAALEEAQQVTEVWRNAAAAADEVERLLAG